MNGNMKIILLRIVLYFIAFANMTFGAALFLPSDVLKEAVRFAGIINSEVLWPDSPLFMYSIRNMSFAYLWAGIIFIWFARAPEKHKGFIYLAILGTLGAGITCLAAGYNAGFSSKFWCIDGIADFALTICLVVLRPRGGTKMPFPPKNTFDK